MELSDLKVFQTVVDTGGITHAAKILHRVPSNVTARIQKLESELDTQLLIRDKNRVRVSPEGERLLVYARKILSLADEAKDSLNHQAPSGVLKVGSMEAVAASRLSPILLDYHQRYPHVALEVSTNPTGVLIEQVLSGALDVGLVADPLQDERIEITPIFKERLVIVSSLSYEALNTATDLGENPTLLGFSSKCAYRQRLTDWAKRSNTIAQVVEINSYHALLNCVTAGMGVGIVPEILLEYYPFKEGLNVHQLPEYMQYTITCLIWRKDSARPSIKAFAELF